MKKKILSIVLIGMSFGINAQEKIQTELGLKDDFIYKNGNIGIGTTNPIEKLSVENGNIGIGNLNSDNWSKYSHITKDDYGFDFQHDNTTTIINEQGTTNQAIVLGDVDDGSLSPLFGLSVKQSNDWKPKFIVNGNGDIGIGNLSADNWSKYSHITKDNYGFDFQHDNATAIINEQGTTNQAMVLGDVDDNSPSPLFGLSVKQSNSWQPKFIVTGNGNVGIGTTDTKGFKLGVKGKIAAEGIKVALHSKWPDFIFYDDYKLPSLQEVETHIKEKGHLKDIPSAKEVEKNGIFLEEMNSKLLQKIEELTLYTIQQQKEIETLKEEKKELKLVNKKLLELQKRLEKLENKQN